MHTDTVVIIVNGQRFSVQVGVSLSFRDVADLAKEYSQSPSMTMRLKGVEGRVVHPGESIVPVEGMIFNVADTSNA